MKAEDILADNENFVALANGGKIRKGSMAAFIANIEIIDNQPMGSLKYQEVVADLKTLLPVCESGLLKHFEVKSPRVRNIIETYGSNSRD
ncbi:hypothetical protein [Shewanella surugensis]|uniref:Uncharacterized protein n=1 Tax=Shewanella surugensis TaxID=212020 RepID=A0ABT0LE34_9GAMM|nr:hypothetical protein [Shewanella surugensis]MCL1125971.1 hypothetical protein [Shewanella surugensis]